jgi:MGT family glycosyltransferase
VSGNVVAICMEGVGHLHCLLPVVDGLQRRGCDVTVMTKPEFAPVVRDAGAQFVDLYDGCPLDAADAESVPVPSRFVTFAAVYAESLTKRVEALSPSLVLYDTFTVVAPVVARALGIPSVNVSANHAAVPDRVIAALEVDARVATSDACRRAVATLRDGHGIAHASPFMYVDNLSPHLNLYPEPPEFLVNEDRAAFEPVAFFGCLRERQADRPAAPVFGPRRGRRVYISFGTVIWWYFADAATAALRSLAQALGGTDAEVVISLGNHPLDAEARGALCTPGVRVIDYVDQLAVLDETDVFVTHHGINSTHEAIHAGVPMLSYPFFGDQPDLARRCEILGLAIPLADEPRGVIDERAVQRALERLDVERDQLAARLAEARTWEEATIADRPQVLDRLVALMAE